MSAFYSFLFADRVHLLTDGGYYDDTGVLLDTRSKVLTHETLPIALTARGGPVSLLSQLIKDMVAFVDSFGEFASVDGTIDAIRAYFEHISRNGALNAELVFICWSETAGPRHFIVQCHGQSDLPMFSLETPGIQIGGGPPVSLSDLAHLGLTSEEVLSRDFPELYGYEVMQAMRQKIGHIPGGKQNFYGVGGRCDLTTVDATGVRSRTLHHWNDSVGQPVSPFREQQRAAMIGEGHQ